MSLPQTDAECVYNVQIGLLKNVFKIYLSDSSIPFTDASANTRYYIFTEQWINMDFNIANALVIDGQISNTINSKLMLSKHDYTRYLSQQLFGTPHATSLFNNTKEIIDNIGIQSHNAWIMQMNTMNKIAATPTSISSFSDPSYNTTLQTYSGLLTDACGNRFLDNTDLTINNITYQLMNNIKTSDYGRLAIDFSNQVIGADGLYSVPFRLGDAIYFYTNFNPTEGQENITGVPSIPTRKYVLKINIVDNNTNFANVIPIEYVNNNISKYSEYCL